MSIVLSGVLGCGDVGGGEGELQGFFMDEEGPAQCIYIKPGTMVHIHNN